MDWTERGAKQKAREWLLEQVPKKEIGWFRYTGLPAGEAIFEQMLYERINQRKYYFRLYEKDSAICYDVNQLLNKKWKNDYDRSCRVLNEDIDAGILSELGTYDNEDLVWLDYCGPINPSHLSVIRNLLRVNKKGLLAVTFMAMRESSENTVLLNYLSDSFKERGLGGVEVGPESWTVLKRARAISEVALSVAPKLEIKVLPYRDTVPMILMTFKRCRGRATIQIDPYLDYKNCGTESSDT